jgi:hypothetical protein
MGFDGDAELVTERGEDESLMAASSSSMVLDTTLDDGSRRCSGLTSLAECAPASAPGLDVELGVAPSSDVKYGDTELDGASGWCGCSWCGEADPDPDDEDAAAAEAAIDAAAATCRMAEHCSEFCGDSMYGDVLALRRNCSCAWSCAFCKLNAGLMTPGRGLDGQLIIIIIGVKTCSRVLTNPTSILS